MTPAEVLSRLKAEGFTITRATDCVVSLDPPGAPAWLTAWLKEVPTEPDPPPPSPRPRGAPRLRPVRGFAPADGRGLLDRARGRTPRRPGRR